MRQEQLYALPLQEVSSPLVPTAYLRGTVKLSLCCSQGGEITCSGSSSEDITESRFELRVPSNTGRNECLEVGLVDGGWWMVDGMLQCAGKGSAVLWLAVLVLGAMSVRLGGQGSRQIPP